MVKFIIIKFVNYEYDHSYYYININILLISKFKSCLLLKLTFIK
jgi:hypothetical protein